MEMGKPKICVIVPVYKIKRDYFEKCVNSIISQTYQNIEIILVDDYSPDDCGKWCDEIAASDERVNVIHNKINLGVSESRNKAIDRTDADYITFVDADDWLDLTTLSDVINAINVFEENPEIIIFQECANYLNKELKPRQLQRRKWKSKEERFELQKKALSFVFEHGEKRIVSIDHIAGKLISVNFLNRHNLRLKKIPYREDGLFFQEIVENANCIIEIPVGMYHYRMRRDSAVNSYKPNAPADQKKLLQLHWEFAKKTSKDSSYRHVLYGFTLVSMQMCITTCFFNKECKEKYVVKHRKCREYFRQKPYSEVFSKISVNELSRSFKIKAFFIKYHMYYMVEMLRTLYMKTKGYSFFE